MRFRRRLAFVVLAAGVFAHPGCTTEDILLVTLPDGGLSVDADIEPREEATRCERDIDCPSDAFCARRSCAARDGRCERRPTFCDGTPAPVCGCDGVTYWNDCLRKARGHTSAIPGECALGSAKGCDRGTKCGPGAVCTRIVPSPEACALNRYWKHFFKRGLVEPEDDLRDTNPPTNPDLFDALAKHFTESGYDLKSLVRTIVQSHTYQLSSTPNAHNAVDRQAFSHFYPKRMAAEVLLDSIDMVTGAKTDFAELPPGTRAISLPDNSYNRASPFLKVFGRPEGASVCECERVSSASLAQSLHLMNAADVKAKLAASGGRAETLAKAELPEPKRIRELYLAAYSREPEADEVRIAENHLLKPRTDAAGKPLDSQRAKRNGYEGLLWALLNTKEFLYNH